MKKSNEVYLPLHWVNFAKENMLSLYSYSDTIQKILNPAITRADRSKLIMSAPELMNCFHIVENLAEAELSEFTNDLNAMSIIGLWAKNKQVFKFDSDFLNELTDTETIVFTKNCLDYLPYQVFYIDISENAELCERILAKGLFIKVDKHFIKDTEVYTIKICRVTDSLFFYDEFSYKNENTETCVEDLAVQTEVSICTDELSGIKHRVKFDGNLYTIFLQQVLSYLASAEPDLAENENTKRTYRKPAEDKPPKDKFSEIRQWDVGVRFGTAFRKWHKERLNQESSQSDSKSRTHFKQRPHSRRAHWSHYWYGSGDSKIRRPKWVASYLVNVNDKEEDEVTTIHKVDDT